MIKRFSTLLGVLCASLLAGPATAQTSAIQTLNSDTAKAMAETCVAMARKNNWRATVAVVDVVGNLLYMHRMDGAPILSVEPSRMKAQTALREGKPTTEVSALMAKNADRGLVIAMELGDFPAGGGVPVVVGGQVVGAIGVGGSPDDEGCARAAIATIIKK